MKIPTHINLMAAIPWPEEEDEDATIFAKITFYKPAIPDTFHAEGENAEIEYDLFHDPEAEHPVSRRHPANFSLRVREKAIEAAEVFMEMREQMHWEDEAENEATDARLPKLH